MGVLRTRGREDWRVVARRARGVRVRKADMVGYVVVCLLRGLCVEGRFGGFGCGSCCAVVACRTGFWSVVSAPVRSGLV